MQHRTTSQPPPISVSRAGVMFLAGHATSLRVHKGHLCVKTGQGRSLQEGRFSRVNKPRLRRVVVFGKGGYTTWEALHWLDGVGAAVAHLSISGRLLLGSGDLGPDQPALRRAQVHAANSEVGLEIVRSLLTEKLRGQLAVLTSHLPEEHEALRVIGDALERTADVTSVKQVLALEAQAAAVYWKAWSHLPMEFARSGEHSIPQHWRSAGERRSAVSVTSPRRATTAVNAILNYLYSLAEFECRLALLAMGLDPGLGWAHKDSRYRDSAALDLLEPLRPQVDAYVAGVLAKRTFSAREFVELPNGQVRITRALARELTASTLPQWERSAGKTAAEIGRLVATSASSYVRVPGQRTRGSKGKGRTTLGRGMAPSIARPRPVASACRQCGVLLEDLDRAYCNECLPGFEKDRTKKLVKAARKVLAEMRASDSDPARSPQAKAKRLATNARRRQEAIAWEQMNPGPHDQEVFNLEILPRLRRVTLPQMMQATGLTSGYCWRIRRGDRIPHPMHWEALCRIGGPSASLQRD